MGINVKTINIMSEKKRNGKKNSDGTEKERKEKRTPMSAAFIGGVLPLSQSPANR